MKSGSPQFRFGLLSSNSGGGGGGGGARHPTLFASRSFVLLFAAIGLMWLYCFTMSSWGASSDRQDSEILRQQLLDLSKKYVKSLASETGEVVDGPYSGRLTGYDLKKTLAVMLHDMMRRLDRIENRLFSGAGGVNCSGSDSRLHEAKLRDAAMSRQTQPPPPPPIQVQQPASSSLSGAAPAPAASDEVDASMLLSGYQENCEIALESKFEYPDCEAKVEWMMKHWRDDPCYARHGVDGSECSMKIFLSEVEEFCPILPFRQHLLRQNESVAWVNRRQQLDNGAVARESARLSLLEQLAGAPGLRERVNQRWQSLASAAVDGGWPDRWPRRRVLAHVGYLSQPQHWPPAEAAQWADLLAGVGLLGHRLTVSIDGVGLRRQLLKLNYAKTECQGKRDSVITHLVTDLVGILQVRSVLGKSFARFACLYRILAPFGVEPKFNDQSFSSSNELNTPVSGLDLSPMQYLSWLPFTLENFYLGLALPPPALPNMTNLPSRVELFIFGFGNSVWKDAAFYLAELRKHFRRIHTAVSPEQHPDVPAYVVNHGLLNYTQYRGLLLSMVSNGGGIFVGLGFPYEHPAPLEAASLGLPFLNLRFKPPLDRTNSDYLREIPVSRKLRSQDPYLESLGEPASFLVDLEAKQLIPATLARAAAAAAAASANVSSSVPKDFTPAAYLARVRALFSAPSLCRVAPLDDLSTSSWAAVRNSTDVATAAAAAAAAAAASAYSGGADVLFYLGVEGRSCSETCLSASKRSVCAPDQMRVINRRLELQERGIRCKRIRYDNSLVFPAISKPGHCHFLSHERLFSCDERLNGYSRLCPCRRLA
ncbi:hypothetical protein BOX15_Mlig016412g4 [Macrostomum lignano]|uniref:alpha-1,6-mannosyl-glycoprotein 6-beta-N-acetylglucosaminyltransferase n=2 Tax=Macrostomum lignano TaxID=282301 RepID=A0A267DLB3_9PLAT|nr:hypothetical protein BOX15_Mlig016412g4 [Macrostomum lignano]